MFTSISMSVYILLGAVNVMYLHLACYLMWTIWRVYFDSVVVVSLICLCYSHEIVE